MTALKINNINNKPNKHSFTSRVTNKISKFIRARLLFKSSELDVQQGSLYFEPAFVEPMYFELDKDDDIVDTYDNEEDLASCYQEMTLVPAGFAFGGFLRRLWKHR